MWTWLIASLTTWLERRELRWPLARHCGAAPARGPGLCVTWGNSRLNSLALTNLGLPVPFQNCLNRASQLQLPIEWEWSCVEVSRMTLDRFHREARGIQSAAPVPSPPIPQTRIQPFWATLLEADCTRRPASSLLERIEHALSPVPVTQCGQWPIQPAPSCIKSLRLCNGVGNKTPRTRVVFRYRWRSVACPDGLPRAQPRHYCYSLARMADQATTVCELSRAHLSSPPLPSPCHPKARWTFHNHESGRVVGGIKAGGHFAPAGRFWRRCLGDHARQRGCLCQWLRSRISQ